MTIRSFSSSKEVAVELHLHMSMMSGPFFLVVSFVASVDAEFSFSTGFFGLQDFVVFFLAGFLVEIGLAMAVSLEEKIRDKQTNKQTNFFFGPFFFASI